MAVEIERKFLVSSDSWRDGSPGISIRQGYLSRNPERTVRIRIRGEEAYITIKGRSAGISRAEFEYAIPVADAEAMLLLCDGPFVEKTRYEVLCAGWTWEVDEFHGDNQGLIVAEIELPDDEASFDLPAWIGREVSHLTRYFNSQLSERPYGWWSEAEREE